MGTPVPRNIAELTPAWLTERLRASGTLRRAGVASVHTEVIGAEQGFTGVLARLQLRYDRVEPGAPATLIAKLPLAARDQLSGWQQRQPPQAAAERAARELRLYEALGEAAFFPGPRCYGGALDAEQGGLALLLEDVAGAVPGDALAGCSVAEARLVIEAVAPLHAACWQSPSLARWDWLPPWSGDVASAARRLAERVEPFLARYGERLAPAAVALVEQLPACDAAVRTALATPPLTLVHGDLHPDNVLFHPPRQERAATIIDWQTPARGRGALDLMLLLGHTDPATGCVPDCITAYHELLRACGVRAYGRETLLHDCRLALLALLGGMVRWLGAADPAGLTGRERALVEAAVDPGWLFVLALELDAAAALPS